MSFHLTRDDAIAASVLSVRRRWLSRRGLMLQAAVALVAVVVVPLVVTQRFPSLPALLGGLVIMAGILLAVNGIFLLSGWWWGRRMLRIHPHLRHAMTVSISEAGVAVESEGGNWRYGWSDFTGWAMNGRVVILMLGPAIFVILPRRVLDEGDLALIAGHLPG
ncbi:MAG: YcxB family protein [Paracoccus sp. (in: a-proteobacteria)]|nr:YcxB family protein [Paracoccus sp. (in: a-proteobacteria)]